MKCLEENLLTLLSDNNAHTLANASKSFCQFVSRSKARVVSNKHYNSSSKARCSKAKIPISASAAIAK